MNNTNILPYKNELYRKAVHICSLFFPLLYMYTEFNIFILFMSLGTSIIIIIDLLRNKTKILENTLEYFLGPVYRPYEKNGIMGATYMLIGFMLISIGFNMTQTIYGMFVVIFSDSMAALIGIKYGKIYLINNKTLEGSFAFIITTALILIFLNLNINLHEIIIIAIISTLTELLTPTKFDNLSIPIVSAIILGAFI